MIRVALVAASPALRAGLRSLLSTDGEISITAEHTRWDSWRELEGEADVVITTSASPQRVDLIDGDLASAPAVLYVGDEPVTPVGRAPGAWGVLPQESSAGELCAAVRALAQGLVVGTPQLLFSSEQPSPDGSPLTEREAEVLRWLARGLANKQIAAELGISEHTVKFHVSSIYTKLNATNRTQAVREGLRNGWIPL